MDIQNTVKHTYDSAEAMPSTGNPDRCQKKQKKKESKNIKQLENFKKSLTKLEKREIQRVW